MDSPTAAVIPIEHTDWRVEHLAPRRLRKDPSVAEEQLLREVVETFVVVAVAEKAVVVPQTVAAAGLVAEENSVAAEQVVAAEEIVAKDPAVAAVVELVPEERNFAAAVVAEEERFLNSHSALARAAVALEPKTPMVVEQTNQMDCLPASTAAERMDLLESCQQQVEPQTDSMLAPWSCFFVRLCSSSPSKG